jgi:hypothetical protein
MKNRVPCDNRICLSHHDASRSMFFSYFNSPKWMKGGSNQCGDEWLWDTRRECVDAPKFIWVDVQGNVCGTGDEGNDTGNAIIHVLDGVMLF